MDMFIKTRKDKEKCLGGYFDFKHILGIKQTPTHIRRKNNFTNEIGH